MRPLLIISVLTSLLHQVKQRVEESIQLDVQQQLFRDGIDSCRDNIILLDPILRSWYNVHMSRYVVKLNMTRTLNSVQHSALTADNGAAL